MTFHDMSRHVSIMSRHMKTLSQNIEDIVASGRHVATCRKTFPAKFVHAIAVGWTRGRDTGAMISWPMCIQIRYIDGRAGLVMIAE